MVDLRKMGRTYKFRMGSWKFGFRWWFQRVYDRTGITNETRDGKFIPFFDFIDDPPTTLDQIVNTITNLQKEWGLSTAYVIQSTPHLSFRAFTCDKVDFRENIAILADCDFLDENYLRSFARRKKSVLRVVSKKERGDHDKIVEVIPNFSGLRDRSKPHEQFFKARFYGHYNDYDLQTVSSIISRYESFR